MLRRDVALLHILLLLVKMPCVMHNSLYQCFLREYVCVVMICVVTI